MLHGVINLPDCHDELLIVFEVRGVIAPNPGTMVDFIHVFTDTHGIMVQKVGREALKLSASGNLSFGIPPTRRWGMRVRRSGVVVFRPLN